MERTHFEKEVLLRFRPLPIVQGRGTIIKLDWLIPAPMLGQVETVLSVPRNHEGGSSSSVMLDKPTEDEGIGLAVVEPKAGRKSLPEPCCLRDSLQTPSTPACSPDVVGDRVLVAFKERLDNAIRKVQDCFNDNILAVIATARLQGGEESVRATKEDIGNGIYTMVLEESLAAVPDAQERRGVIEAIVRERVSGALALWCDPPT